MANYYVAITNLGSGKLSAAQAGSGDIRISQFVMGDANGQAYLPNDHLDATALVNERARFAVDSVTAVSPNLTKVIVVIPATVGGFNVQEIGLLDDSGELLYLGNYTGAYKPIVSEGASGVVTLEIDITTNGLGTVVIEINPNIVYATQDWVNSNFVLLTTYDAYIAQDAVDKAALTTQINAETTRAEGAEGSLSAAIGAETTRAEGAEGSLGSAIDAEVTRAQGAEASLSSAISAEATRAEGAESSLNSALAAEIARALGVEASLQTQINDIDFGTALLSTAGYLITPSGIILQWCLAPSSSVGDPFTNSVAVTFPMTFPTAVLATAASFGGVGLVGQQSQGSSCLATDTPTQSGCNVTYSNEDAGGEHTYQATVIAIGC